MQKKSKILFISLHAFGGVLLTIVPGVLWGQVNGKTILDGLGKSLMRAVSTPQIAVRVNKSPIVVDSVAHTARIEFSNPGDDTLTATIEIQSTDPRLVRTEKDSILVEDDPTTPLRSLVPWLTDMPKTVRLAPRETKTVTVHLNVPAHTSPGEYTAWIVATTKHLLQDINAKDAKPEGGVRSGVSFARGSSRTIRSVGTIVMMHTGKGGDAKH